MKLIIASLLLFSTNIFSKDMLRGPSSFIMEKDNAKTSKVNCYGNCGESCHVLPGSQNNVFMKSQAQNLCESKTASVICFEAESENDLLHSEMCINLFDDADEGEVSAAIDMDNMIQLSK